MISFQKTQTEVYHAMYMRNCEEISLSVARDLIKPIVNDPIDFYALKISAEPKFSQRRNNAYITIRAAIERRIDSLLSDHCRVVDLIGSIHGKLIAAVSKPDATPETVLVDGSNEVAKVLLPIYKDIEKREQERAYLSSFNMADRNCAF